MTEICPWCEAPREDGPKCPRCGVSYKTPLAPAPAPLAIAAPTFHPDGLKPATAPWSAAHDDRALEWKLRLGAIPIALLLALLFHASPLGHFLQRTFLSMMVHEVGHAVTAWLCGFAAVPMLWKTLIAGQRGVLTPLFVAGSIGYLLYRAHRAGARGLVVVGGVLAVAQLVGTLALSTRTAQALIVFGGDGGALVLGTALMTTFFFGRETQLYQGWLRWGFVVIGAAAFVDTFATWWAARTDWDAIPFGEQEGVGLSDPSQLNDHFGWTANALVSRYVALGVVCLIALAAVFCWGVLTARKEALR